MNTADVKRLQSELMKRGYDVGAAGADGDLGTKTTAACVKFTNDTLGIEDTVEIEPVGALRPLSEAELQAMFGRFEYTPRMAPDKSGWPITYLSNWEANNIEQCFVPQLAGKPLYQIGGKVFSGIVRFHKKGIPQLKLLFEAWAAAGLIKYVLTFDGAHNGRFMRGSSTKLSNHAYGTAFDINANWNGLGQKPAKHGETGCLLDLVPLAEKFGFYWGGKFSRVDAMHFEIAKLLQ